MPRIFISHSNLTEARKFSTWLSGNGITSYFLDADYEGGFQAGTDWEAQLYQEIERATAVVLLLTKEWFDSKWCMVEAAYARAIKGNIVPVVWSDDGEMDLPIGSNLQRIWWNRDSHDAAAKLLKRLHDLSLENSTGFSYDPLRGPYPGLMSFGRDDAAVYFGREPEVRDTIGLLEALRHHGPSCMVHLHGESGSGKSSLLKAGILPRLRARSDDWIVIPEFHPHLRPLSSFRDALRTILPRDTTGSIDALLENPSPESASCLVDAIKEKTGQPQATILLAIDQFEEAFTSVDGKDDRRDLEHFLGVLRVLLNGSHPVLAIATLRSSDLSLVLPLLGLPHKENVVLPFPLKRLRDVILKPAKVAGVIVEPALVDSLVEDASSSDSLPLLAFLLRRLYDLHGHKGRITLADLEAAADPQADLRPLETCIRDAATKAIRPHESDRAVLDALRRTFVSGLVRIADDDGRFSSRNLSAPNISGEAKPILESLVTERLLVRREDGSIEVAHEALFRAWPLLAGWLEEERDFLQGMRRIEIAAEDWLRLGKPDEELLGGYLLRNARIWLDSYPDRFKANLKSFVHIALAYAGKKAEIARSLEESEARMRYTAAITSAEIKLSQNLPREAFRLLHETKPELRRWEWGYLNSRCDNSILTFGSDIDYVTGAAYSKKLRCLVTTSEFDDAVTVWQPLTGQRSKQIKIPGHGRLYPPKLDLSGERMLTVRSSSARVSIQTWDLESGEVVTTLQRDNTAVSSAELSADGTMVLVLSNDESAGVWDAANGLPLFALAVDGGVVWGASFSSDGKRILTRTEDYLHLWDSRGILIKSIEALDDAIDVAELSPNGDLLAVPARNFYEKEESITVYCFSTDRQEVLKGHKSRIRYLDFSPDGGWLASLSEDGNLRLWDTENWFMEVASLLPGKHGVPDHCSFGPNGSTILLSYPGPSYVVYNTADLTEICRLEGNPKGPSHHAAAIPILDDHHVLVTSFEAPAKLWHLHWARSVKVFSASHIRPFSEISFKEDDPRWFHHNGKTLQIRGPGTLLQEFATSSSTNCAIFSEDGTIAMADCDGKIIIQELTTRQGITCELTTSKVIALGFSSDNKLAVVSSLDDSIRLFETASGSLLRTFEAPLRGATSLSFSADDRRLVAASPKDQSIDIWDVSDGSHFDHFDGLAAGKVSSIVLDRRGRQALILCEDECSKLIDLESGAERELREINANSTLSANFSPEGDRLVTASKDGRIRIWELQDGKEVLSIKCEKSFNQVSFSRDGKRLATVGDEIRIWDSMSAEQKYAEFMNLA